MSSGLLSLKWNNHRSTFFHVLSSIRSKESYCDATLACDGRFYPVHKLILSTCSEYFEQIFERTQCKHPVIVLKDIKHDDLEALMNYMYVGEVNVLQEKLAGLIKAAECLKIKGLAVPDEDPLVSNKKSQLQEDVESPRAKRRRREGSVNYEERERHGANRNVRSNPRDHPSHLTQTENCGESSQIEHTNASESKIVDNHSMSLDGGPEPSDSDQSSHRLKRRSNTEPSSHRLPTPKPIHEISVDETSVKAEPPDIQEEVEDSKEMLHSNLGYDPLAESDSINADPSSVASGSNEAHFPESNMLESTPQSVEDVVAQALPPTSSSFQGNSFSMWEGEGSLQNFPTESFTNENSQGRPMGASALNERCQEVEKGASEVPTKRLKLFPGAKKTCSESSTANERLNFDLGTRPFMESGGEKSSLSPPFKKFVCNICKFEFKSLIMLKTHKQIHSELRQYSCPQCSYKTFRKQDLSYHFRTHTGEKPYSCPFCAHKSSVMSNMKTHIRRRHAVV